MILPCKQTARQQTSTIQTKLSCTLHKLLRERLSEAARACLHSQKVHVALIPPPVDSDVGRSRKPGVEDVNTAHSVRSPDRLLEGRIVVEPQALPEPVDCIYDHYFTGQTL